MPRAFGMSLGACLNDYLDGDMIARRISVLY